LRQDDLLLYRPLRLEALRRHPEAFGSTFEEEQGDDLARLIGAPPNLTLGGFVTGALVGSAGLVISPKLKQRHKGHIVGVYVDPAWRRTGLARALLDGLIDQARAQGLVVLTLSVTVGNTAARRLYIRAGFTVYGVEPLSLRVGADLLDEELMVLRLDRTAGDVPV
jgi:ribosomal protein S18 acetylase RimI-like enzyme